MYRRLVVCGLILTLLITGCTQPSIETPTPTIGPTVHHTYTLSSNITPLDGGSIFPSRGSYESDTRLILTATPASDHQFDYWSGDVSGTNPTITITMDSNKNIIAHFKVIDITPTANVTTYPSIKEPSSDWELKYELNIAEGSNLAEVIIYLDDPGSNINRLYLRTKPAGPYLVPENYISNLRSEGGKVVEDKSSDDRYTWEVAGTRQAKLLYTVNLNVRYNSWQDTNVEGYSSFASSDWVVTAGGLLFITTGWSGSPDYPHITMKLNIPNEWESYIPYPEITPRTYDVTGLGREIRPRSFIVAGKESSFDVANHKAADSVFTVVAIKPSAVSAEEFIEYVTRLSNEYAEISSFMPPYLLSVIAPEPMRRFGGEGQETSIFVSDNNPFPFNMSQGNSTYAHELFHLFQKYKYSDEPWIGEGVTTYYQFYGLLKAGYITAEDYWNTMVEVLANRPTTNKTAILSSAGKLYYMSPTGDPYNKGALITLALDIKIREDTGGKNSFDDVLRIMNTDFYNEPVSSDELKLIISSLTGKDYGSFFTSYVQGSGYPEEIFNTSRDIYIGYLMASAIAEEQGEAISEWRTITTNIDYDNPELYLASGAQSSLNKTYSDEIDTQIGIESNDIEGVAEIFNWKQDYFRNYSAGGNLIGKTTANQIMEEKALSGCHDHALILASVFRYYGFPAVMVDTAGIKWAWDYSAGERGSFSGHVFVEVYVNNNWILVNSTSGEYVENYDPSNPVIPMTNPDEDKGYFALLKGLDPENYGVTSIQLLKEHMAIFAERVKSENIQFPKYEVKKLSYSED